MSISTRKKDKVFSEINITPLTDIFLVLLIIMMVVAPAFQSMDNSISTPEINSGVAIEPNNATISITREGEMFISSELISDENLVEKLIALRPSLEKPELVIKADENTKNSQIMKVMNAAKAAEFEKLVVAGEPLSKKDQKELVHPQLVEDAQVSQEPLLNNVEEWSE